MNMFKKAVNLIFYYVLGTIIANLAVGILHLILKISLVTVQGPTLFSQISAIVTYYIALCIAAFLFFRLLRKRQSQIKGKEIILYGALMVLLHFAIVFFGGWNIIWFITNGPIQLAEFLYTGGESIASLTYIPKLYYFLALLIDDICFMAFALIGHSKGTSK